MGQMPSAVLSERIRGAPRPLSENLHGACHCHSASLQSRPRDREPATSAERSPGPDDRPDKRADPILPWPYQLRRVPSHVRRAMDNTFADSPGSNRPWVSPRVSPGIGAGQREELVTFCRIRIVRAQGACTVSTRARRVHPGIGSRCVPDHSRATYPMGLPGRRGYRRLDGR